MQNRQTDRQANYGCLVTHGIHCLDRLVLKSLADENQAGRRKEDTRDFTTTRVLPQLLPQIVRSFLLCRFEIVQSQLADHLVWRGAGCECVLARTTDQFLYWSLQKKKLLMCCRHNLKIPISASNHEAVFFEILSSCAKNGLGVVTLGISTAACVRKQWTPQSHPSFFSLSRNVYENYLFVCAYVVYTRVHACVYVCVCVCEQVKKERRAR